MANSVMADMKIKREDLNPATVQLEISCSEDQIKSGFEKAVRELGKKVRVPGFRPGKAPKHMIEEGLNPQALYEKAADVIIRAAYDEVLEKESIKPDGMPSVDISMFHRGGETLDDGKIATPTFDFKMKVPLAPVVELADYKGLQAQKPAVEVTDDEINHQIDELRRGAGKKSEVTTRGIQEGDAVVLSLSVDWDANDTRSFMVIAGQTFPGLDKAIMGMSTDDVKVEELSFPDSFQHEAWKGQKLKTKILVKSVSAFQLPDLTDEFAAAFNFDNVDALKERVREGITTVKQNMVKDMVRDQLLDSLLEKSTVHVADNTWEGVVDRRIRELGAELERNNATFAQYFEANNLTEEQFMDSLRDEAKVNVRRALIIQRLFQDHGMKIENSDVDFHFRQVLAENNVPQDQVDAFTKQYGGQVREEIIFRAMASKVTDLLIENAKVEEVKGSTGGKAPAKASSKSAKAEPKAEKAPAKGTKKPAKK